MDAKSRQVQEALLKINKSIIDHREKISYLKNNKILI